MAVPFLLDTYGNTIYNLTQWDVNQKLIVSVDQTVTIAPKVHFCNQKSEKALVVESTLSDNKIVADIPNILLQEPYRITAYVYLETDIENSSWKTIQTIEIPVRKRPKPDDYEYVENVKVVYLSEMIKIVETLNQDIRDAESAREENENVRISNENERINNENTRIQQEAQRQQKVEQTIKDIAELKGDLVNKQDRLGYWERVNCDFTVGQRRSSDLGVWSFYYGSTITVNVNPREKYKITGLNKDSAHPTYFMYGNGSLVKSEFGKLHDEIVTIPNGVDTLYVNGRNAVSPVAYKWIVDSDEYVIEASKPNSYEEKYVDFEYELQDGMLRYLGSSDTENRIRTITQNGSIYRYLELSVVGGEKYIINIENNILQPISFYDGSNFLIGSVNEGSYTNYEIIVPQNVYKIVFNTYTSANVKFSIKKKEWVEKYSKTNTVVQSETIYSDISFSSIIDNNRKDKWNYLFHDNFTREDNISDIGSNSGDNDHDFSYNVVGSTIGINGNCAYLSNNASFAMGLFDKGVSDGRIDFLANINAGESETQGCGVVFRYKDSSNYWYCVQRTTSLRLYKVENGSSKYLGYIYTPNTDDLKIVSVEFVGNRISVLVNGFIEKTIYNGFLSTETTCGIIFEKNTGHKLKYFDLRVKEDWYLMNDLLDDGKKAYYVIFDDASNRYSFDSDITNNSNYSSKLQVLKSDNVRRCEIAYRKALNHLSEQWYEWDVMLGEDYGVFDVMGELIMQMHDSPDNDDWSTEHAKISPNLGLYIENGHYKFHRQWASNREAIRSELNKNIVDLGLITSDIGKWIKWKLHVKWGYESFFEPITELYKDGELVYCANGLPNCVNGAVAPYFKVGCYTYNYVDSPSQCNSTSRTMWVDNINVYY